jgi:hypothetical protein
MAIAYPSKNQDASGCTTEVEKHFGAVIKQIENMWNVLTDLRNQGLLEESLEVREEMQQLDQLLYW